MAVTSTQTLSTAWRHLTTLTTCEFQLHLTFAFNVSIHLETQGFQSRSEPEEYKIFEKNLIYCLVSLARWDSQVQ